MLATGTNAVVTEPEGSIPLGKILSRFHPLPIITTNFPKIRFVLSYLLLDSPSVRFPTDLRITILYPFLVSPIPAPCPAHRNLLHSFIPYIPDIVF
jgi:hypothetical protein